MSRTSIRWQHNNTSQTIKIKPKGHNSPTVHFTRGYLSQPVYVVIIRNSLDVWWLLSQSWKHESYLLVVIGFRTIFFFITASALRTIDRLWLFFLLVRWSHKEGHCVMSGPFITDYLVWVLLLVESRTVSRWPIVAYTYVILYLAHCCFIGNHSHTISFYFHIENWIFFLTTIVTSGRINA